MNSVSRLSRVFKLEEWASAQENQQPSNSSSNLPSNSPSDTQDTKSVEDSSTAANMTPPSGFRKRLLSSSPLYSSKQDTMSASEPGAVETLTPPPRFRNRLLSAPVAEIRDDFSKISVSNSESSTDGKMKGVRNLVRRASQSLKRGREHRHSHAVQDQPHTAWGKLKSATSFQRQSKHWGAFPLDNSTKNGFENYLTSPIPGSGSAPPIIPLGSGGAARATAAAQNEYFGRRSRQFELLVEDQLGDRESGIGIAAISMAEPESYDDESDISRVDFIDRLPVELAIQVLARLGIRTLYDGMLVSRRWATIINSPPIWRELFMREKTKTFATGMPCPLGDGLGLPKFDAENDWKDLFRIRHQLDHNWREGLAAPCYLNGHLDSIYCVQFDESKIVTGSRDKTIRIWDMKTYACTLVIGPPDVVYQGNITRGSDLRPAHYITMADETRRGYSVPKSVSFDLYHDRSILSLQYDGNILVTGSSDGTAIVYDIKRGYTPIRCLRHHTAAVLDLAFDDKHIITCSKDATICIWNRETGNLLKQLRGHAGPVNAVQLRGNTIVSCSGDFKVKLWNIDTGKNIREFVGHTKGLACSQFSEDSRFIASAGNDKTIRLWDAHTGECLKVIEAHENLVRSLHIDSVSGRLVSGSYDQDIKVFDLSTGNIILDFPKWHSSWVLGAKSDYRRIVSAGQDAKVLMLDFGHGVQGIEKLESL